MQNVRNETLLTFNTSQISFFSWNWTQILLLLPWLFRFLLKPSYFSSSRTHAPYSYRENGHGDCFFRQIEIEHGTLHNKTHKKVVLLQVSCSFSFHDLTNVNKESKFESILGPNLDDIKFWNDWRFEWNFWLLNCKVYHQQLVKSHLTTRTDFNQLKFEQF